MSSRDPFAEFDDDRQEMPAPGRDCPLTAHLIRLSTNDPELPDDLRENVRRHVEDCPVCQRRFAGLKRAAEEMGEAEPAFDSALGESGVLAEFAGKADEIVVRKRSWTDGGRTDAPQGPQIVKLVLATAACVLFLVLGANYMCGRHFASRTDGNIVELRESIQDQLAGASKEPNAEIADAVSERLRTDLDYVRREDFNRFARLMIDDQTLLQVQAFRISGDRDQWRAMLARYSFEPVKEDPSFRDWAGLNAFRWGIEYFVGGDFQMAEGMFVRAYHLRLRSPELYMALANVEKMRQEWETAAQWLREMLDQRFSKADQSRAANLLAFCLYRQAQEAQGDERGRLLEAASEAVDKAIDLAGEQGYSRAHVQRALLLDAVGKHAEAGAALRDGKQVAERKLKDHPGSPRLLFALAIMEARLGEVDDDHLLKHFALAVQNESRDFPVSFWWETEPAFADLDPETRDKLEKIVQEKRTLDGDQAPLPLAISGMLWDEPFKAVTEAAADRTLPVSAT